MIELVPAAPEHIPPVAANMRPDDVAEVTAMGLSPQLALKLSLAGSLHGFTAMLDGEPIAMLGLVPKSLVEGLGAPWLLGTEAVYRQGRALIGLARKVMPLFSDSTPSMTGLVAEQNVRAIRYLRRIGFTVGEERQVIGGTEFVQFTMERR